jgi:multiple sugar transport system permease protein/sn-glycerol 3-phosphate transport system permease protein
MNSRAVALGEARGDAWAISTAWRPHAYLLPLIVLLGVFTYWPLLQTFRFGFLRLNPGGPPEFVGLQNYAGVFAHNQFQDALRNSVVYALGAIPLKVLLPIPIAFFIWTIGGRIAGFHKSVLFVGLGMPVLLSNADTAIYVILGVSAWKILGFNVLLYLAGLASIRRDLIEAMRVDGAGDWVIFRRLIVPLLSPTIFFVLISTVVFSIQQVFTPIDVMTQGGPANATTNLFYIAYQYTFESFNIGFASAAVTLLFLAIGALLVAKLALLERHVHYG